MVRGLLIASVGALAIGIASPASATSAIRTNRHRAEPARTEPRPRYATEVVGRVVDGEGHGIAGVSVIATPVASTLTSPHPAGACVVTDRLGRFRLVGIPPGDYWFIGIHGDYPFGMTPALPVGDRLEVAITLDLAVQSA